MGGFAGSGPGPAGTALNMLSPQALTNPVNQQQLNQSQAATLNALQNANNLAGATAGVGGLQNQQNVYQQLGNIAAGRGPNPAQAMLNQATGQNVANQASLAASQRGAGANVGLLSRQAAQQGVNAQQQAAGQGASLQAQQSLGALGQMGGIAGQQVGQQLGAQQFATNAAQQQQANLLGALGNYNQANVGLNSAAGGFNAAQMQSQNQALGGGWLGNAITGLGGALTLAQGGSVSPTGPQSSLGKMLARSPTGYGMARGGAVKTIVSPGEVTLTPQQVDQVKGGANPLDVGSKVPGKAAVGGAVNSYENDTVPMDQQEGSIVIPRSKTQAKNPREASRDFVTAVINRKR